MLIFGQTGLGANFLHTISCTYHPRPAYNTRLCDVLAYLSAPAVMYMLTAFNAQTSGAIQSTGTETDANIRGCLFKDNVATGDAVWHTFTCILERDENSYMWIYSTQGGRPS